jgi:hypothetical protein
MSGQHRLKCFQEDRFAFAHLHRDVRFGHMFAVHATVGEIITRGHLT